MSAHEAWHVTRTMRALEVVAHGPCAATDVADALMIHTRTARRMLNRLVDEGYLARAPDSRGKYVATLRIVALAGRVAEASELVVASRPYVRRLCDETGASAHVTVPSLVSALCLLHAEADERVPVPSIGERVPAHATAAGKALLAARPRWRSHVLHQPLERFTLRTLLDRDAIEAELQEVTDRGWAWEDGEYRDGVRGIAAPVWSNCGQAAAALGVAGRIDPAECGEIASLAAQMAAAISEAIGYESRVAQEASHG